MKWTVEMRVHAARSSDRHFLFRTESERFEFQGSCGILRSTLRSYAFGNLWALNSKNAKKTWCSTLH